MKEYLNNLGIGRKIIILLNLFMIVLFIILYSTFGKQKVIRYEDHYLRHKAVGDVITYSGKVNGEKFVITVEGDDTVSIQSGDTTFGPYTIVYDDTAVPDEEKVSMHIGDTSDMIGVEVFDGKESIFRGAYSTFSTFLILTDENGEIQSDSLIISVEYGTLGSQESMREPSVDKILALVVIPEITTRGEVSLLAIGIFLNIFCIISIIFEDQIFRYNLQFRIRDVETAEPSEWEMFSRWISWIVLTGAAIFGYFIGLFP